MFSAEHLIYADPSICHHLSVFINICIVYGCLPEACLSTILSPICKNKNEDDANNYRPIAVASVVSKLVEHFICSLYSLSFKLVTNNLVLNLTMVLISVVFT